MTGPFDVLVQVGAAGLCRTDLHIVEGQWAEKSGVQLPYVIGHENAGWVREVGPAVSNVAPGDAVILHPLVTCGLCGPCRRGDDVHCENSRFPGATCVVIGAGGLGHIGVQCLVAMTAARVVVVDPNPRAREFASQLGAHEVVTAGPPTPRNPTSTAAAPWPCRSCTAGPATSRRSSASCSTGSAKTACCSAATTPAGSPSG